MSGNVRIDLPEARKESHLRSGGPAISVRHLDKSYDGNHVLNDMSFDFERGKVYVIMGPSGCGKSTLLRHMIGAEQPDAGEVLIDGIDIHSPSRKLRDEARRKFGVLFQSSADRYFNGSATAASQPAPTGALVST